MVRYTLVRIRLPLVLFTNIIILGPYLFIRLVTTGILIISPPPLKPIILLLTRVPLVFLFSGDHGVMRWFPSEE